jgi:VanZ family protein
MRPLLIFAIILMLYVSLSPWQFAIRPGHTFLEPISFSDKKDILLNFWLYVPLGALVYWSFPACGAWLSVSIELIQYFLPGRVSSQTDILSNTMGTLAGAMLATRLKNPSKLLRWTPVASQETFLLSCWCAYMLLPMIPVHGFYDLRHNLGFLRDNPFVWTDVPLWVSLWVALWHVLPAAFRPGARIAIIFPALLLMIPARLFLINRAPTKAEVVGAALGALCVLLISEWSPRAVIAALAAGLLLRDLAPFHYSVKASPFIWIPFQPFLSFERAQASVLLCLKLSWYGFAVWFTRKSGLTWLKAGVSVALFLLVIEVVQLYNPGHVAEITDPLIALFLAAGFAVTSEERGRHKATVVPGSAPHALEDGYR